MSPADKGLQIPEREDAPGEDPAIVAGKAAEAARTVCDTIDISAPEHKAALERVSETDEAFADAPVTSVAGALAKMREIAIFASEDDDSTSLNTRYINTVVAFLEGRMVAAKPDPVVTLFAKWAIIRDEATALSAADPKGTDPEKNERWENAIGRCDAVEDQIMETPATSMQGVAIKIRLASHYVLEAGDFDKRYATPARDLDYEDAHGGHLGVNGYVISALRDAERLAGGS